MDALFLPLFTIVIVALVVAIVRSTSGRNGALRGSAASFAPRPLFTPAERSFLGVLDQAVGTDMRVFAKVRLADLIHPRPGLSRSDWTAAHNRIRMKHVDFVLCGSDDLRVLAVVELDDASHRATSRRARDALVDRALASAGIPVHRVAARAAYTVQDVRAVLNRLASAPPSADRRVGELGGRGRRSHGARGEGAVPDPRPPGRSGRDGAARPR